MPWYKLSRRDCATVTHLYKLSTNTEQQHAMRTVRNIVERLVHQRKVCARRTALWGDVLQANRTLTFQVLCSNPLLADFKLQLLSATLNDGLLAELYERCELEIHN